MKKIEVIFNDNGSVKTVNDGLNDAEILLAAKQMTLSVEWHILRQWQAAETKEKQTEDKP